jgi:hypothetical protein
MMWFSDLFPGWSWDEILRMNELFLMGAMILISVFAMGAASEPARVSSKCWF